MPVITRFDHVGITVQDLDAATAFFVDLGLEVEGRAAVEGEFIDTVTGIPGSSTEIVMLHVPGGGPGVELARYVTPEAEPGMPEAKANVLGLRSIAFEVEGLRELVDRLVGESYALDGGVGQFEGAWRMAYVRGPEGIIVALAERLA